MARHRPGLQRTVRCLAASIAWMAAWPWSASAAVDVTELSLEQLMKVELPALSTTARFTVSATAKPPEATAPALAPPVNRARGRSLMLAEAVRPRL